MEKEGKPFHLLVFFTFGVSLETWVKTGLLYRELSLYRRMVKDGHQVTLVTYGDERDFKYRKLTGSIRVLPVYTLCKRPSTMPARLIHSLALPFLLKERFVGCMNNIHGVPVRGGKASSGCPKPGTERV